MAIAAVLVDLLGVCLTAKIVWDYRKDLDPSSPGQRRYAGIEDGRFLKVRLMNDERLLNVVHYWVLPGLAGSLAVSAGVLWWVYKRGYRTAP